MDEPGDEIFDDLHEGVEALRDMANQRSVPLSERAAASLQRLESAVPRARDRARLWRDKLAGHAKTAAVKTDEAAHQYPWLFTLGALGLGLFVGYALSDRNEGDGNED